MSGKAKPRMAAATDLGTVEAVDAALVQIARSEAEVARLEAEIAEARSLDLPHGRIGWRKVTSIKLPRMVERVIAALRVRKLFDAICVKETVRKEILDTYEDATLEAVGAKRVVKDDFYIAIGEAA